MFKRTLWLAGVVGLLVALVACQAAAPATRTVELSPSATAIPAKSTATSVPKPTSTASGPAPTPTTAWQVPQPSDEDWVEGGAKAKLVVVEYSDLQ